MTKYLILIAILVLIYLYWKYQQTKVLPHNPDDIIERKGKQKEVFFDAQDFDLHSDDENQTANQESVNFSVNEDKPILSRKKIRKLKKKK